MKNIVTGERMLLIDKIMLGILIVGTALLVSGVTFIVDLMAMAIGYFIVDTGLALGRAREGRSIK